MLAKHCNEATEQGQVKQNHGSWPNKANKPYMAAHLTAEKSVLDFSKLFHPYKSFEI